MRPLFLLLLFPLLLSCTKTDEAGMAAETISKKVRFEIFSDGDNAGKQDSDAFAEVELRISRRSLAGGTGKLLWDTTLPLRSLGLYPKEAQKIVLERTVLMDAAREQLTLSTLIRYHWDQQHFTQARQENWFDREQEKTVQVRL